MGTPYGYSGYNAYQGNSGGKIAMALAGGVVAGVAGSYLYNHYNHMTNPFSGIDLFNTDCSSGSWSGRCSDCKNMFSASRCIAQVNPKLNANRDDLMNTAFIPKNFTWPIKLNFTNVTGADWLASELCPPPNWNPNDLNATNWTPHANYLFVALTYMVDVTPQDSHHSDLAGVSGGLMLSLLSSCCCLVCFCVVVASCCNLMKKRDDSSSSDSDSSDGYYRGHEYGYGMGQVAPGPGGAGGFMTTQAPNGMLWQAYCQSQPVRIDENGFPAGAWGECLVWAKVYERRNPQWERDPDYMHEGPCGQVIAGMMRAAPGHMQGNIEGAANHLEEAAENCAINGRPLPIINEYC